MTPEPHARSTAVADPTGSWPLVDDPRVAAALEVYLSEAQSGRRPSRGEFLDRYPEVSGALATCLDGLEFLRSAARGLSSDGRFPDVREGFAPATCLGDYRIVREIGRGGMGVVYEAEQVSLGRRVALKVLPFAAAIDPKQRQRFHVEAQAAAHLHHPHIVPIFAVGDEGGTHFYAMPYIEGRTLAATIQELRRFGGMSRGELFLASRIAPGADPDGLDDAPATASLGLGASSSIGAPSGSGSSQKGRAYYRAVARLGVEAAEALEHAHGLGVLHRDIKPANLIIDNHGKLWITDFGLARFRDDPGPTRTGDLLGTLRYMSPEQLKARRGVVDQRADVYALGATLYEALTLRPAFTGRDRQEIIGRILSDEPARPRKVDPSIPRDLETILLKAMAKEPASRYATAQEMADDLRRFLDDRAILACPPPPHERAVRWVRKHRTMVATATVVLLAATTVGSLLVLAEQRKTSAALAATTLALRRSEESLALSKRAMDATVSATQNLYRRAMETMTEYGTTTELRKQDAWFFELALQYYEGLVQNLGDDPDPKRREMLARAHLGLGISKMILKRPAAEDDYVRSIRVYEALIAELPGRTDLVPLLATSLRYLAMKHNADRRYDEAERAHARAVALARQTLARDPGNPGHASSLANDLVHYARILGDAGRGEEAERALREVLASDPANALARNNLAWLLAFNPDRDPHDPRRAVGLARQVVKADPEMATYWNTLGLALVRVEDWRGATEALERSMGLCGGGMPHDWFLMALVHARTGERAKALPLYRKGLDALNKNPSSIELAQLRDEVADALGIRARPKAEPKPKRPLLAPPMAEPAGAAPEPAMPEPDPLAPPKRPALRAATPATPD